MRGSGHSGGGRGLADPAVRLRVTALAWWLGSVVVFAAAVASFDDLVYGGPLNSGYRPGEITFSLGAVLPNLRYMPSHLVVAMFGPGAWSFAAMRDFSLGGIPVTHSGRPGPPPKGGP